MENSGSVEAGINFPQLLKRIADGEEFTIIDQGKPVARLVPALPVAPQPNVQQVIDELKAFGQGNTLGERMTIREMIEEGRRF